MIFPNPKFGNRPPIKHLFFIAR